jgi:predicted phosphoadenosine phosphosulfate sulfurtransferase
MQKIVLDLKGQIARRRERPTLVGKAQYTDKNVYDAAIDRINYLYDRFDSVLLSFSAGKDSAICMHLMIEVAKKRGRLPVEVHFFDEEAIPLETDAYVRKLCEYPELKIFWYCVPIKHRSVCSQEEPWWYPWAEEDRHRWVRPMPPEAITSIPGYDCSDPKSRWTIPELVSLVFNPTKYGFVGQVLGIRAQESMHRFRAVSRRDYENFIVAYSGGTWGGMSHGKVFGNIFMAYPIYDWRTEDVWTAFNKFGWPYNAAYDRMEEAGTPHLLQRIAPPFGEEPTRSLWQFKVCFPEIWDKMVNRVAGANTCIRYRHTELYGDRIEGEIIKPDELSCEEFTLKLIKDVCGKNLKLQSVVADHIRRIINYHYNRTSNPILMTPHPMSLISWKYLWSLILVGGDLKGRRLPVVPNSDKMLDRMSRVYEEEYNEEYSVGKGRWAWLKEKSKEKK